MLGRHGLGGVDDVADAAGVKVVALVSVPPPVAGQSMATLLLLEALESADVDVVTINIGRSIADDGGLRGRLERCAGVVRIWTRFLFQAVKSGREGHPILYAQLGQSQQSMLRDLVPLLLAKALRWPVIGHVHGGAWRNGLDGLPRPLRVVYESAVAAIDTVVVLTPRLAAMFDGVVDPKRIQVVGNGVSAEVEAASGERPARFDETTPMVLFLSNLLPEKGYGTVIEAARLASERALGWRFVLAGSIPPGVTLTSLPPNTEFLGPIHGREKIEALSEASVFVLPTEYSVEGEPIAILEAMHFGLPIVTCDQGGICDIVGPEEGELVQPGDAEALVAALGRFLQNEARWLAASENNHRVAKAIHSRERHAASMLRVLHSVGGSKDTPIASRARP